MVEVKLDKKRHLKFGINTLIEVEKELGKSITTLDEDGIGLAELVILYYHGLKWEDKELTRRATGDLIDAGIENNERGFEYIGTKLGEALGASLGAVPSIPEEAK